MANILIIGATSAIAKATARLYAESGDSFYLIARDQDKLTTLANDLSARGATGVDSSHLDVSHFEAHQTAIESAFESLGSVDVALIAHGTLPDQQQCQQDNVLAVQQININAISTISLLTLLANKFEMQAYGTIAVITSVAGDRGRQSNYVYGSAKAMVSVFLQGLRNRLYSSGINVLDIKPGFVDTPMTAAFDKGPLWASPEGVAKDIQKAVAKGKHSLYTPFFWRYIMLIIQHIPEFIFRKLSL